MSDRILVYGRTTAADRGRIRTHKATWPEIAELFREPVRRNITMETYLSSSPKARAQSKNTGLFFGGKCAEGKRGDSTLEYRSVVNLDIDSHASEIWEQVQATGAMPGLEGIAHLVHTTRSHTEDNPKLRVLLPLARDVEPAEYEPVTRALAELIDSEMYAVARESFVPAQGMYFPSVSVDQDYHFFLVDGEPFDPDEALAKYPADDATTWPKARNEKVKEYVAGRKMTHPEEKKGQAPIITAVARVFDPYRFIDEFLSHVYVPSGDRYFPVGASGAPSVRIYDDAFIHSDHASDPAHGQHNVFDLGRIHLFGHLDEDYDLAGLPPPEWPSYKAMVEFMLENEEVREQLALVEAEVEAEKNEALLSALDGLDDDEDDDDYVDDLIGTASDDEEDLIGADEAPAEKKAASITQVLAKVRKSIAKAKSLDDLERRAEIIRGFPATDFRPYHRELLVGNIQDKVYELTGEKLGKAEARKMLAPTVEDLRSQVEGKPLPTWLEDWVFVAEDAKFLNLDTKLALSKEGFDGKLATEVGDSLGVNDNGVPIISASMAALAVYGIVKADRRGYHPGKPATYEEDGILYANTYRAPDIQTGGYAGKEGVKLLTRLMRDLFPERQHREIVMDFLAHCVRYPEKKLRYALLIKGQENEGKTLLATLISKLVGAGNYGIVGSDQLKEKFNGWAYEKTFCVVEEIKIAGKEAYDVLNKIKPVISNNEIAVRRMQKDVTTERNFCNMLLTTNYEDCLPLEEDNTRFAVVFTRFKTNQDVVEWHKQLIKEEGRLYVQDLWEHIQERPVQFLEAFSRYKFSERYNPAERAPHTIFKQIMADDSKTDERVLLERMLESEEDPTITSDILVWNNFRAILDEHGLAPNLRNRGVGAFLKPLGFVRATPFMVDTDAGRKQRVVWTRNTRLLDKAYNLTPKGRDMALAAIEQRRKMSEDEFEESNVVPFRAK